MPDRELKFKISTSADNAALKETNEQLRETKKAAQEAGSGAKELGNDMGEMSKAARGAYSIQHGFYNLLEGNLLGALKNVTKGFKLLWTAMLENPFTAIIAGLGLLIPLLVRLGMALAGNSDSAKQQEEALKRADAEAASAAASLDKLNKAKLEDAVASAKGLADTWERAVKAAHDMQAAQDKLTSAKMAQELAGLGAEKEVALSRVRGDKDAERRTELHFAGRESDIRNRYAKEAADEGVRRAADSKIDVESESQTRNRQVEVLQNVDSQRAVELEALRNRLANWGVATPGGKVDQAAVERQEKRFVSGGDTALLKELKEMVAKLPLAKAASDEASKKAVEAVKQNAIHQEELSVKRQTAQSALESAQYQQRTVSSTITASGTAQSNRYFGLESSIAEEHRQKQEQEQRASDAERQRILREQQQERNRLAAEYHSTGGDIVRRKELGLAGQPSAVAGAYREQEREALERLVQSVKSGTTADLLRQLNEAMSHKDNQEASILRETLALLKQVQSQRVNDARRGGQ